MSAKLQYRFSQHEATPPPGAWQGIAARLDEEFSSADGQLSDKLQAFGAAVPAGLFAGIADQLDAVPAELSTQAIPSATEVPVVPVTRQTGRVVSFNLRRIAAAGIIILAIGALYYFISNTTPDSPQLVRVTPQSQRTAVIPSVPDAGSVPVVVAENRVTPRRQNISRAIARINESADDNQQQNAEDITEPENDNINYSNVNHSGKVEEEPIAVSTQPIRDKDGNIIMNEKLVSAPDVNYVTVTAPNGEQTRMSKKFLEALGYMNSSMVKDDYPGLMLQEGSSWKWLFQEWRNKLLKQPSFIPTATNFLDIMELKEMLHDNF